MAGHTVNNSMTVIIKYDGELLLHIIKIISSGSQGGCLFIKEKRVKT